MAVKKLSAIATDTYNPSTDSLVGVRDPSTAPVDLLLAGVGNVTGPSSSTNNDIVTFNGTTGQIIQDSGVSISSISGAPFLPLAGGTLTGGLIGTTGSFTGLSDSALNNTQFVYSNSGTLASAPMYVFGSTSLAFFDQVTVTGTGGPTSPNGIYAFNSIINAKPSYKRTTSPNFFIYFNNALGQWVMNTTTSGTPTNYFSNAFFPYGVSYTPNGTFTGSVSAAGAAAGTLDVNGNMIIQDNGGGAKLYMPLGFINFTTGNGGIELTDPSSGTQTLLDAPNRTLNGTDGTPNLFFGGGSGLLQTTENTLDDGLGNMILGGYLQDQSLVDSIDTNGRQLLDQAGNAAITWGGGPGVDQVITLGDTGGTYNSIYLTLDQSGTLYPQGFNFNLNGFALTTNTGTVLDDGGGNMTIDGGLNVIGDPSQAAAIYMTTSTGLAITGTGGANPGGAFEVQVGSGGTITGTSTGTISAAAGGQMFMLGGAGGIATNSGANGTAKGGAGSTYQISSGVGGASNPTGTSTKGIGGAGGTLIITSGKGGDSVASTSGNNTSGFGGPVTFNTGNGGTVSGSSATNTAGHGGSSAFQGGNGGFATGGTAAIAGAGGGVTFEAGTGGGASGASVTNTNGNGGTLAFVAGKAGSTGTGGVDGSINFQDASLNKIISLTTAALGFFGTTPVSQQSGDIITALSNYGLVVSGTISQSDLPAGIPIIVANPRMTGLTAAQALATYTVGASDTTFAVSANVNITAVAVASFQVTCTYTDETNTSRTVVLNFSQINGTFVQTLTAALGAGAYGGVSLQIRAKAGTTIIIASTGTFTSVTYNLEERLIQL